MTNVASILERQVALKAFPEVRLTETHLHIDTALTFERWQALGEVLQFFERSSAWLLGSWAIYGERTFGENYAQAISEDSGYAVESVKVAQWVAERVTPERRHADLSWAHHRAIAALEPEDQVRWLDVAADEKLTTRELYERSHDRRQVDPETPAPPPDPGLEEALRSVLGMFIEADHLDDAVTRVMRVLKSHGVLQ